MNVHRMIFLAATMAFAGSVQAQSCSGGADGGMDATGNQCGSPGPTTFVAGAPRLVQPVAARGVEGTAKPAKTLIRPAVRSARAAQADAWTPTPVPAVGAARVAGRVIATGAVLP